MLILDQWARNNIGPSRQADTSLVYEPIIRRHGYTVDDYTHTVEGYLRKPARFAEVFEKVQRRLQARADYLTAIEDRKDREQHRRDSVDARTDYRRARIFAVTGEPTLAVRIELDSAGVYNLERMLPDTLYDGLFFYLRDSLMADSLLRDSLLTDSLAVDSLRTDSQEAKADSVLKPVSVELKSPPVRTPSERPLRTRPANKDLKIEDEANIREVPVSAE